MNSPAKSPKGGGQISLRLVGSLQVQPHSWQEPGRLQRIRGLSAGSQLPAQVAERQRVRALEWFKSNAQPAMAANVPLEIEVALPEALSPGSVLFLVGEYERVRTGFSHLGERGLPAEQVAIAACRDFGQHHASGMAIDPHLADQLLLPMALAGGDSHFTTSNITQHCLTNAWLMQRFLPLQIIVEGQLGQKGIIRIHV
ncbi:MAG: hypothetical protein EXR62_15385 [Chloroflexi bacterium]|nr:hypothetical protein [Chloroflexota bacterium]